MWNWKKWCIFLCLEAAAEYLHAQEGEYEDEEDEEDQQGVDRGDRVHQGLHQVPHRRPVSEIFKKIKAWRITFEQNTVLYKKSIQ